MLPKNDSKRKLRIEELNRPNASEYAEIPKHPFVIILDNIRSLHNIGAVFRTGDSFLVEKIYLCGITAQPPHREIQKTALGATDTVSWEYYENTCDIAEHLKGKGYKLWAVEQTQNSFNLKKFIPQLDCKHALILGHEVRGVEQKVIDLCDGSLEIPQEGTKHSLNISVASGIVMWEFYKYFTRDK